MASSSAAASFWKNSSWTTTRTLSLPASPLRSSPAAREREGGGRSEGTGSGALECRKKVTLLQVYQTPFFFVGSTPTNIMLVNLQKLKC